MDLGGRVRQSLKHACDNRNESPSTSSNEREQQRQKRRSSLLKYLSHVSKLKLLIKMANLCNSFFVLNKLFYRWRTQQDDKNFCIKVQSWRKRRQI